jgi:ABC-type transport system involved in cytochrome c biogenesis permease subunit
MIQGMDTNSFSFLRLLALAVAILGSPPAILCGDEASPSLSSASSPTASSEAKNGLSYAAKELDWDGWQHMPVFSDGRMMPLDTFAREAVEAICGTANPTFAPPEASDAADEATRKAIAKAREVFPDGSPKRFQAAELLFSWLVEPERWEWTAILKADDAALRLAMGLPLADRDGRRLRYVSLDETENNVAFGRLLSELQEKSAHEGKQFKARGLDKRVNDLVDAYERYRQITFLPRAAESPNSRFLDRVRLTSDAWWKLAGRLQRADLLANDDNARQWMVEAGEALQKIVGQMHGNDFTLDKAAPPVAALRRAIYGLASQLTVSEDRPLAAMAAELQRQTIELHASLYEYGEPLRLVPSLNLAALEENRTTGDDAQPWLSVQELLYGSADLLSDYPQQELLAVRKAWDEAKTAYFDRHAADRPRRFAEAMRRFVDAVRGLGQAMEPLRQRLSLQHRDPALLAATAYPPANATLHEVFYNRLNPFFWSWSVSLASLVFFVLSSVVWRKGMFWMGVAALLAAQTFTLIGFAIRMDVTGLVPLTGMFETVVFVALCVAFLGLWLALTPLFHAGLHEAWKFTAFRRLSLERAGDGDGFSGVPSRGVHGLVIALRIVLILAVLAVIVRWPMGCGTGIFDLLPPIGLGASVPSVNECLVWLAGLCVAAMTAWFVPRLILALSIGAWVVPRSWKRHGLAKPMHEVFKRRLFALGGAGLSCLAVVLACYAPATVMKRNIGAVAPILRDNHWLVVHVVTIMASYAAAAIALLFGNVALGHYLFGRYRDEATGEATVSRFRRPPAACATLARYVDATVQITVLLLTAGTILGALWADKSWGRFWAWDPKEVWALISLLVYLVILHAKAGGWAGDFGMAVAAVLGATAVLFTYYGVNFLLGSGMHSYGAGSGGQWQVATAVAMEWLFLLAAGGRYVLECGRGSGE